MPDSTTSTDLTELGFDADALREKYRIERDKRLRGEGRRQYINVANTGDYSHYLDDPSATPIAREPLVDEVEVAIIGGGFGGLLTGARLRESGVADLRIIEKAADFGGTWYWNRYPGVACDTESYIYMPLLEETGYIPTEKYAKGPEIYEHCRRIGQHFDLYRDVLFQTEVAELRWSDSDSNWVVSTDRGDRFRAKFVVVAGGGGLQMPKLPGIEGIAKFKGHSFHTARWDFQYTAGGSHGNLTGLADKRVGVIGTGATAVQCLPHLGASAKHLYVFQRTPSSVDVRANRPTDLEWMKSLPPGWQRERIENFSTLVTGGKAEVDLVADGWTEIIGKLARRRVSDGSDFARQLELADFEKMEEIRHRAEEIVNDPDVAESLKPYYRQFCKRPCFHDEYLPTYNRMNVTLVDTQGHGVERITEKGIVANGVEFELDCIIYASGYEVVSPVERLAGYMVYGRNSQPLSERWRDGISTLFGMQTRHFPNMFIIGTAQTGGSANITHKLGVQSEHISYIIQHAKSHEVREIDITEDAENEWVQTVIDTSLDNIGFLESCTPGNFNNEGQPNDPLRRRNGPFVPGIMRYQKKLDKWRAEGNLEGLVFTH